MRQIFLIAIIIFAESILSLGQAAAPQVIKESVKSTLAERLGYPRDAKLLIVHADDLGMAHSVNAASVKAFESGLVNSGSIMVPCPWFSEIAGYARTHPEADLGLHLTFTSEWSFYRWGSVLSAERAVSLIDPSSGYLYPAEDVAAARINPSEAMAEIRAQIERARRFGVSPTHLDSHMGTLYQNKALFEVLLRVARDSHLPVRVSKEMLASTAFLPSLIKPEDVLIDRIITIGPDVPSGRWNEFYTHQIKKLQPGVSEMVIHLAFDDEEMRAATFNHPDWGANWRQRDFDFFTSAKFRRLLEENNIKLVTWREIGKLTVK
jgi:predicted glycoside hydrolase/deacetylase ChbG (UPF0249 family)